MLEQPKSKQPAASLRPSSIPPLSPDPPDEITSRSPEAPLLPTPPDPMPSRRLNPPSPEPPDATMRSPADPPSSEPSDPIPETTSPLPLATLPTLPPSNRDRLPVRSSLSAPGGRHPEWRPRWPPEWHCRRGCRRAGRRRGACSSRRSPRSRQVSPSHRLRWGRSHSSATTGRQGRTSDPTRSEVTMASPVARCARSTAGVPRRPGCSSPTSALRAGAPPGHRDGAARRTVSGPGATGAAHRWPLRPVAGTLNRSSCLSPSSRRRGQPSSVGGRGSRRGCSAASPQIGAGFWDRCPLRVSDEG